MAEVILNHRGGGRFRAYSGGSHPKGHIHPLALKTLRHNHLPTDGLRSKSWEEFAASGAPKLDFIVTVCDHAAQETCPVWPGRPVTAHWSITDPAAADGSDAEREHAFQSAFRDLDARIKTFVNEH